VRKVLCIPSAFECNLPPSVFAACSVGREEKGEHGNRHGSDRADEQCCYRALRRQTIERTGVPRATSIAKVSRAHRPSIAVSSPSHSRITGPDRLGGVGVHRVRRMRHDVVIRMSLTAGTAASSDLGGSDLRRVARDSSSSSSCAGRGHSPSRLAAPPTDSAILGRAMPECWSL
jgi:hypothetical protein